MRRRILASTGLVFGLLIWALPVAGDEVLSKESAQRMRPVIPAAINYYNERTDDPLPVLTTDQTEDLLEGKVVRIRRRPPAMSRIRPRGSPATGSFPCPGTRCGWQH